MFPIIAAGVALAGGIFAAHLSNESQSSSSRSARSSGEPLPAQSFIVTPIPREGSRGTDQASLADSVRKFLF